MSPVTHVLLLGGLSFGVPLALAVWELMLLRRATGNRSDGGGLARPVLTPSPDGDDGELPPLPACLIPSPDLVPVTPHEQRPCRQLETV